MGLEVETCYAEKGFLGQRKNGKIVSFFETFGGPLKTLQVNSRRWRPRGWFLPWCKENFESFKIERFNQFSFQLLTGKKNQLKYRPLNLRPKEVKPKKFVSPIPQCLN